MTYTDYEALPVGALYQLIDGELTMTPSPTTFHQNIIGTLHIALHNFVKSHGLGRVFLSPIDVRLTDMDIFQPDLVFVGKENVAKIGRDKLNVIPDLVVEVLSPSNAYYNLIPIKKRFMPSKALKNTGSSIRKMKPLKFFITIPADSTQKLSSSIRICYKALCSLPSR